MRQPLRSGIVRSMLLSACVSLAVGIALGPATAAAQSNPIVIENLQPGTNAWELTKPGNDTTSQVKGYASATSVNKGDNITFHVSVNPAQTYTIDVYRMGWYQGLGGRLMQHIGPLAGVSQPTCPTDATTGMIECHWTPGYTLTTQASWTSGVYFAVLTNEQLFQNYITFVVRDDSRVGTLLYQQTVTTYQAYNDYPYDSKTGKSLYAFNSFGATTIGGSKAAVKVSFDRPYLGDGDCNVWGHCVLGPEMNFIRWMEKSGYDVTYATDVDTHTDGARLLNYRGLLSVAHDEYWSKEMYDAVTAAKDAGVNLGFFGANAIYWQIRFEPSTTGVPNRVIVCYRDAALDPNTDPTRETVQWRDPPVNRPEQTLIGVMYTSQVPANGQNQYAAYVVTNSGHWAYDGTGFSNGSIGPKIVGNEADRLFSEYPQASALPGTYTLLSHSPYSGDYGNSSIYQAPSGAWVFGAGAINWGLALDNYAGSTLVDARMQRMTANILDRFLNVLSDFSVAASPGTRTVTPGGSTSYSVAIARTGGFAGDVTLSVNGLPSGATGTFTPNPATGSSSTLAVTTSASTPLGTYTLTIAGSNGSLVHTSGTFELTVNPVTNNAPTISNIPDQTISPNTSAGPLAFTVGDTETPAGSLTVTGTSSNTVLVPNGNIVFGGSGANRTVTVTPPANQTGTATITVTVSDGSLTASDPFVLTVTTNSAPTISNIPNQTIDEDTVLGPIGFTVGDIDTPLSSLTLTGTSSNTTRVPNANIVFGGSGASRTVTVTPAANATGAATITVTVSDGATTATDTFRLTVSAVNDAPTISDIADRTINEDTSTGAIPFTIGDVETAAGSLTVTRASSNTTVVPLANVVLGGSGANRTVTVTPAANQSGTATITVTVSDAKLTATDTFIVTVTPVNDAPTISNILDQTISPNTSTASIGFTVGDVETAAGSLTVMGTSSNTTLVPNGSIVFGGSGANRTVTVTPAANQTGSAIITVTVNDGTVGTSDTFALTVTGSNTAPTISDIADRTTNEDTSTGPIAFTIGDAETAAGSLTVTRASSNTTLVPLANVVLGGSGANRTVTVTPAANLFGNATITVTVSDGALTASDTFLLTVTPVNDAPTISNILDQTISPNTSTAPIAFTVGDVETAAGSLTVTGTSGNTTLVPNGSIVFGGSGASRTVTVTPAANQTGTAIITVTVNDGTVGTSDTFALTVTATNTAPTISDIADRTTNEDTSTGPIAFTIGDAETAAASLTVTRASSNTTLVPLANVVLGGSGAARTVTVTPAANLFGSATITVTVSDGALTASDTFLVTVNAVNDPPAITDIASQSIVQNTSTSALGFTIADLETAAASLILTGASSNPTLVPDANIVFGGSGSSRTVTVTPAANQTGTATITVTVSDGVLTGSDTFVLTVTDGSTPAYLLSESFEGPGFENAGWSLNSTPNPNYTTTALEGLESLNTVGTQYVWRPFVNATTFSMYFQVRWNTWTDYTSVVNWDDSNWGAAAGIWAGDNVLYINHGTTEAFGTTPINPNTTYHVWVEWTKGAGTNGTMTLYVSTTGIKPAAAEATITTGKGAGTERMYLGANAAGPNVIFDRVRIAAVPIGNNP